jgi:DNA-directed RNA polymerase specialized sigma24 family protein
VNGTYTATAIQWEHGWELHVEGIGLTQVRVLANAKAQVRDLIETVTGQDASDAEVVLSIDLDNLADEVAHAQRLVAKAAQCQAEAAEAQRKVVARLRDRGVSVSDIGTIMGRSRGRVSQLMH